MSDQTANNNNLLRPQPKYAKGMQRLNRWPAIGFSVAIAIIVVVVGYTLYQKQQRDIAAKEAADREPHGAGEYANFQSFDEPPGHHVDTAARPPVTAGPIIPPEDLAEKTRIERWKAYYAGLAAQDTARDQQLAKQLSAPSSVKMNTGAPSGEGAPQIGPGGTGTIYPDTSTGMPPGMGGAEGFGPGHGGGYGGVGGAGGSGNYAGVDPLNQAEKRQFVSQKGDVYGIDEDLKGGKHGPKFDAIFEGTAIPITFVGGLTTDMPGMVVAQVDANICDTANGSRLLIPQFTRVIGKYDNSVSYGQERVGIGWTRFIFPDSSSRQIGQMEGADQTGYAGAHDIVNTHFWDKFWAVALVSLAGAAAQISQPQSNNYYGGYDPAQVASAQMTLGFMQLARLYAEKGLSIPNTIEIRPGWKGSIMVQHDIHLPTYYDQRIPGGGNRGSCVPNGAQPIPVAHLGKIMQ